MATNEEEVRAIVDFFTRDSDEGRFCGLGTNATPAQVEQRFGDGCFSIPNLATFEGREVEVTSIERSGEVVLGSTTYRCLVEVLLPTDPVFGIPQVDVRLVRDGYVMTELKAAARELRSFFTNLYGPKLLFERDGTRRSSSPGRGSPKRGGEIWIETSGNKKADEVLKLTPSAVLRVQASRR